MELSSVPSKRKIYLSEIGKLLTLKHGQKKSYKIKAIQQACKKSNYAKDFGIHNFAWIVCVFSDKEEFIKYADTINLTVNYERMRKMMLRGKSYEEILTIKRPDKKSTFDSNDISADNLIDPNIIGDV